MPVSVVKWAKPANLEPVFWEVRIVMGLGLLPTLFAWLAFKGSLLQAQPSGILGTLL